MRCTHEPSREASTRSSLRACMTVSTPQTTASASSRPPASKSATWRSDPTTAPTMSSGIATSRSSPASTPETTAPPIRRSRWMSAPWCLPGPPGSSYRCIPPYPFVSGGRPPAPCAGNLRSEGHDLPVTPPRPNGSGHRDRLVGHDDVDRRAGVLLASPGLLLAVRVEVPVVDDQPAPLPGGELEGLLHLGPAVGDDGERVPTRRHVDADEGRGVLVLHGEVVVEEGQTVEPRAEPHLRVVEGLVAHLEDHRLLRLGPGPTRREDPDRE